MIPKYIYELPSLMSSSDLESVYELVSYLPENSNILEIGCFLGSVTCTIKEACNKSNLYCVDIWSNEVHNSYLQGYDRKTIHKDITSDSTEWQKNTNHLENVYMYKNNSMYVEFDTKFDFIFLDGGHSYQTVMNDLTILYGSMKDKKKVILCDDYGKESYIPEVEKAINDFTKQNNLKLNLIENRFAEIIT